jgi:peptidoglycan/xylan/chitin deacetylase (PgdA/CDA1 family)
VKALAIRIAVIGWRLAVRLTAWLRGDITFFVAASDPVAALTLDDGPDPSLTPRVLDLLRAHGARATFFLIGSRAERHPELVRSIRDAGHEIGNHMWRDERASALSDADFERSVLLTERTLGELGPTRLLRPGSGFVGRRKVRLAERHGYRCVLGSVHPFDAQVRSPRWMADVVRALLRPGVIVILHEGSPSRTHVLAALDDILSDARRRGCSIVPAGELLRRAGEAGRRPGSGPA